MNEDGKLLINLTRGTIVCHKLEVADTARRRMRGLLGRKDLPNGEGLLLDPAPSIHTAFMRFPIDAMFVDGTLRVRRVVEAMPPWRAASVAHAWAVIELPAGQAARCNIGLGDQLGVVEVNGEIGALVTALARKDRLQPSADGAAVELAELRSRHDRVAPAPNPFTVAVVGSDRRFRSVAAALLVRRGWHVVLGDRLSDAHQLAREACADVVLIDSGTSPQAAGEAVARISEAGPSVGTVVVADEADELVLARWGSFDDLCAAIEAARLQACVETGAVNGHRI